MSSVACNECRATLPAGVLNSPDVIPCPNCQTLLRAVAFPALYKHAVAGMAGERLLIEGEASCFYHSQHKAVVPCGRCGRFLCALCDVDLDGVHLCPSCLEAGASKGELTTVQQKRPLHDNIALAGATYPIVLSVLCPVLPFLLPVTAVATIVYAIRHWRSPGSIVPRSKARFIIAILLAAVELLAVTVAALYWAKML